VRPVLVELGPLQVNAWGVMAALAVLAAARVAGAELQRRGHARANAWPLVLAGRRNGEILAGLTQPQVWALAGALAGLALLTAARPRQPAPQPAAAGFTREL